MQTTTVQNNNYYIRLPAGLSLTSAIDSNQGQELVDWVRVGSTQIYIYTVGFDRANNVFSFTVRRDM